MTASLRGQIVGMIVDGASLALDDIPVPVATIKIFCDDIGSFYPSKDFSLNVAITPPRLNVDAKPGRPASLLDIWSVGDRDVIVRFDSEEPKTEHWKSTESDYLDFASFVSPHQPYAFLERLATGAHHQLAVRFMLLNVQWTAVFDISEAETVAQEVLEICPESD